MKRLQTIAKFLSSSWHMFLRNQHIEVGEQNILNPDNEVGFLKNNSGKRSKFSFTEGL